MTWDSSDYLTLPGHMVQSEVSPCHQLARTTVWYIMSAVNLMLSECPAVWWPSRLTPRRYHDTDVTRPPPTQTCNSWSINISAISLPGLLESCLQLMLLPALRATLRNSETVYWWSPTLNSSRYFREKWKMLKFSCAMLGCEDTWHWGSGQIRSPALSLL